MFKTSERPEFCIFYKYICRTFKIFFVLFRSKTKGLYISIKAHNTCGLGVYRKKTFSGCLCIKISALKFCVYCCIWQVIIYFCGNFSSVCVCTQVMKFQNIVFYSYIYIFLSLTVFLLWNNGYSTNSYIFIRNSHWNITVISCTMTILTVIFVSLSRWVGHNDTDAVVCVSFLITSTNPNLYKKAIVIRAKLLYNV